MNWPEVIGALGGLVVTVFGTLRGWQAWRDQQRINLQKAELELQRQRAAADKQARADHRAERRESIDEWQEVAAVLRHDINDYRAQVHALRNEQAAMQGRLIRAEQEAREAKHEADETKREMDVVRQQVEACEREKEALTQRVARLEKGER